VESKYEASSGVEGVVDVVVGVVVVVGEGCGVVVSRIVNTSRVVGL
jgi:hypothetical protein